MLDEAFTKHPLAKFVTTPPHFTHITHNHRNTRTWYHPSINVWWVSRFGQRVSSSVGTLGFRRWRYHFSQQNASTRQHRAQGLWFVSSWSLGVVLIAILKICKTFSGFSLCARFACGEPPLSSSTNLDWVSFSILFGFLNSDGDQQKSSKGFFFPLHFKCIHEVFSAWKQSRDTTAKGNEQCENVWDLISHFKNMKQISIEISALKIFSINRIRSQDDPAWKQNIFWKYFRKFAGLLGFGLNCIKVVKHSQSVFSLPEKIRSEMFSESQRFLF